MDSRHIAIMVYGNTGSGRDALTEEKYKDLGIAFTSHGFNVSSVLYNDDLAGKLSNDLLHYDAVLVWVNPIEQGNDRKKLDSLLAEIAGKGVFVSTHPDVILKMGTKEILYSTKDMDWGGENKIYTTYDDFVNRFPESLQKSGIRVLKQYRGNGGNGVYKIMIEPAGNISMIHAVSGNEKRTMSWIEFNNEFKPFFSNNGTLIDQEWNGNTINGMVRCYLSGTKVAGFGYQEINALYELNEVTGDLFFPPSKRYYFTENCGLFSDLKEIMENKWVPELQNNLSVEKDMMPVIWDADFFINKINNTGAVGKYQLCEINVSCVSPFPPSAIKFIVEEVASRIRMA
jgi:hypothetical protein